MIRYEQKFGVTGNEVNMGEEESKKVASLIFTILGCVFMILGAIGVATSRSPEDYTKTGEHLFTYAQINTRTSTSRTKRKTTIFNLLKIVVKFLLFSYNFQLLSKKV